MPEKYNKMNKAIIILAVLLALSAGGLAVQYIYVTCFAPAQSTATVPDNLIGETPYTPKSASGHINAARMLSIGRIAGAPSVSRPAETDKPHASKLELYQGHPGDNERFEAANFFPGDSVTKYFSIRAYHSTDIQLFFRPAVTKQTKALGDVLHIKVTHMETGKILCDAPFSKVDGKEFSELLKGNANDETIARYRVDVSLDTTVGNEYQAAQLTADFEWYVKDEGGLIPPPQTGDGFHTPLWAALAASALLGTIFLCKRRKEGVQHESIG